MNISQKWHINLPNLKFNLFNLNSESILEAAYEINTTLSICISNLFDLSLEHFLEVGSAINITFTDLHIHSP